MHSSSPLIKRIFQYKHLVMPTDRPILDSQRQQRDGQKRQIDRQADTETDCQTGRTDRQHLCINYSGINHSNMHSKKVEFPIRTSDIEESGGLSVQTQSEILFIFHRHRKGAGNEVLSLSNAIWSIGLSFSNRT